MSGFAAAQEYSSQGFVAAVGAGTATREDPIFVAPRKCRVTAISVVPQAASTGDGTNRKNLNVLNKGAAGAGTTEIAGLDLGAGVNLVAFDEKAIPMATAFANGADLEEGDVLSLQTEQVGTGVAVGPLHVNVDFVPV